MPHWSIWAYSTMPVRRRIPHGLTDIGSYAFNGMRMEKAYRASGELTNVGPLDVGLDRFVVSQGRDFIGQDALISHDPEWELFYCELR